ncbi:MAG: ABC transporter permease [Myxococcaceae bacterium]|nr:ABC transporter permease [Myxococcaceae bacterium]
MTFVSYQRIFAVAQKELFHIFRDPFTLATAMGLPIFMVLVFGVAIEFNIQNIKIGVVNLDQSMSSRQLLQAFSSSHYFILKPPYILLGMLNFPFILALAVFVFKVPMRGSFIALLIAAFAFVCTAVASGTLISTFCKNQQQATLAAFLFMFPMIMFSGLMFPIENMPIYLQWLSTLDPLTHFIGLLRNILLKGGGTEYIIYHLCVLFILAILSIGFSLKRFRTTL